MVLRSATIMVCYEPLMNASKHSIRAVTTLASKSKLTVAWSMFKFVIVAVKARIECCVNACVVAPFRKISLHGSNVQIVRVLTSFD